MSKDYELNSLFIEEYKSAKEELLRSKTMLHQITAITLSIAGVAFSFFLTAEIDKIPIINLRISLYSISTIEFVLGLLYLGYLVDFKNLSSFLRSYAKKVNSISKLKANGKKYAILEWEEFNRLNYNSISNRIHLVMTWGMQIMLPSSIGAFFSYFAFFQFQEPFHGIEIFLIVANGFVGLVLLLLSVKVIIEGLKELD